MSGAGHDREPTVDESKRELAAAREQQTATAAILAAISKSPTNLHRVFSEIAMSACRVCDAHDATIYELSREALRLTAHHGSIPVGPVGRVELPMTRGIVAARAVLDGRPVHVTDLQAEVEEYPEGRQFALRLGHRTILAVPLVHAGAVVGVINIRRTVVRPFTERQIDLLKTFADQAAIAIENTRLFEAEQASKRELQESLEYQTATTKCV